MASAREKYRAPENADTRKRFESVYREYAKKINRSRSGEPKVENNTTVRFTGKGITYRHHYTDLLTIYPDGSIYFANHSWGTVTTRKRQNGFICGKSSGSYHRFDSIPLACAPDKPTNPVEYVAVPDFQAWRGNWDNSGLGNIGHPMKRPQDLPHLPVWNNQEIREWRDNAIAKDRVNVDTGFYYGSISESDAPCCNKSDFTSNWTRCDGNSPCDGCRAEYRQTVWDEVKKRSDALRAKYPRFEDWKAARKEWLRANRITNKEIANWEMRYCRASNSGGHYYPGVGFTGMPYDPIKYRKSVARRHYNDAIRKLESYV